MFQKNNEEAKQPQELTEAINALINIQTAQKTTLRKQASKTFLAFLKNSAVVCLGLIVFHWASVNFKIDQRLKKVNIEIWISISLALTSTWWEWWRSNEQEKIAIAQRNAETNGTKIKAVSEKFEDLVWKLDGRIASLLLQYAQLKKDQDETEKALRQLEESERSLDRKIAHSRHDILQERIAILNSFYTEMRELHSSVSFLRGLKEAERPDSIDKLNSTLLEISRKIEKAEVDNNKEHI